MDAISSIRNKAMKFTEEFTKKCLEAVINDLKNECILSIDDGRHSPSMLEGDFWIDVYNPDNEETFSINYSWDYTVDDDDFDIVLTALIVSSKASDPKLSLNTTIIYHLLILLHNHQL